MFLSKSFIENRVRFFADSFKNELLEEAIIKKRKNKKEIKNQIKTIEKSEEILDSIEEINNKEEEKEIIKQNKEDNFKIKDKTKAIENSSLRKEKVIKTKPSQVEIFLSSLWKSIKDFFSTNTIAKLWWVLVFLTVVYFLTWVVSGIWDVIWPVWRIILWFIVWFLSYWIWVKLHSKSFKNEWLILMWVWILINYAVILSWRYIVWDNWYLSEGTTFFFLILNTIFWVITSLVYKSKTLLIFSFIFGYLNPFIIWAKSNWQPYTLIWYSLIISLWALFISYKHKNIKLLFISFIFWNLLFLLAPFTDSIWWASKIILTALLSISVIFTGISFKESKLKDILPKLYIGTYIFVILNLLNWGSVLNDILSFIVYNIIILWLFIWSIYFIKNTNKKENNLFWVIFIVPLIIFSLLLLSWKLFISPLVLVSVLISYIIWFIIVNWFLSKIFSYILFGLLIIFILLFGYNFSFPYWNTISLTSFEFWAVFISSFIFLFSSYYFSSWKWLWKLYIIWTIWWILTLLPIITLEGKFFMFSIIWIIIFAISNLLIPFLNKNLIKDKWNLDSLIIGALISVIFLAFEIYNFWKIYILWNTWGEITWYVTLWFLFLGLAIIYFIEAFLITQKLDLTNKEEDKNLWRNVFYTYLAISISLFSFAIAFVFSKYPEIITITWLFEATILYYFYNKTKESKILIAWNVLYIIWVLRFSTLIWVVKDGDFMFLISFIIIFISFILNLKFISFKDKASTIIHYIVHIIAIGIMAILLLIIIPSTQLGFWVLWISIFILVLGYFYNILNIKFLKIFLLLIIWIFYYYHAWMINNIFYNLENNNKENYKIIQYIVTAMILFITFTWNKLNTNKKEKDIINIITFVYIFIVSNIYVYDIFENLLKTFSLTIYWWFIASILLIYGINNNLIKFRTIWLYFLTLTSAKIFLYDVWLVWGNARIFTFWVLWVIFIVISTLYSKRYWDNLIWEFSFNNISWKKNNNKWKEKLNKELKEEKRYIINEKLKDIDIWSYKSVTFKFINWRKVIIKAKNLIKIALFITRELWKNTFDWWELKDVYKTIVNNYKSSLNKRDYKKIKDILKDFVDDWWEVVIK